MIFFVSVSIKRNPPGSCLEPETPRRPPRAKTHFLPSAEKHADRDIILVDFFFFFPVTSIWQTAVHVWVSMSQYIAFLSSPAETKIIGSFGCVAHAQSSSLK